jgi:hypothetical protein
VLAAWSYYTEHFVDEIITASTTLALDKSNTFCQFPMETCQEYAVSQSCQFPQLAWHCRWYGILEGEAVAYCLYRDARCGTAGAWRCQWPFDRPLRCVERAVNQSAWVQFLEGLPAADREAFLSAAPSHLLQYLSALPDTFRSAAISSRVTATGVLDISCALPAQEVGVASDAGAGGFLAVEDTGNGDDGEDEEDDDDDDDDDDDKVEDEDSDDAEVDSIAEGSALAVRIR